MPCRSLPQKPGSTSAPCAMLQRITIISPKPKNRNASPVTMYWMPIIL